MMRPPPLKGNIEQQIKQIYLYLFYLVEALERLEVKANGNEH